MTGDTLAAAITGLVGNQPRRREMAAAARKLARPDAAERIADRVEELGRQRPGQERRAG
jgi:UDP-N-acetylglucosamine:LPS N-acetylglucosamine transferase